MFLGGVDGQHGTRNSIFRCAENGILSFAIGGFWVGTPHTPCGKNVASTHKKVDQWHLCERRTPPGQPEADLPSIVGGVQTDSGEAAGHTGLHSSSVERVLAALKCLRTQDATQTQPPTLRERLNSRGNDPSAGSPTETLLRLHLPLDGKVYSTSREPPPVKAACPRSEDFTGPSNR